MSENTTQKKPVTFGKIMLASGVGTLIVLVIIGIFKLLFFFGIVGSMGSDWKGAPAQKQSFLKLDLTKAMEERTPSEINSMLADGSTVGFSDLIRSIAAAADDPNINGLYLYMGSMFPFSWGQSQELRSALIGFCDSGKPILAYADGYSQQGYFVASVADSIYMNPSGFVEFRGIGAESLFFKELLDRLGVKMTLIRPQSNSFKSAGEMYTMNHFSDANRKQMREYISSIWDFVVEKISETRDITPERLNALADNLEAFLADDALKAGLVDRLCFESDIRQTMTATYNGKHISELADYAKQVNPAGTAKDRIAVIYAEGDVNVGTGFGTAIYSDKLTKAINDAAEDDNIKAIVLRVNSPGGMVTASEIITNAVRRAKEKKPLVVSMSDVAASAGYEISCYADYIIAQPTTVTGSIGVFATLPEVGGTLKRHLGITTDTVKTNTNSTGLSILRPLSPKALEVMQRNVEDFYKVFVGRVAEGRHLAYNYVDSIARGRVWTGVDALQLGLVDALGGLDDAIAIAAERAGMTTYNVVDYLEQDNIFDELLNSKSTSGGTIQKLKAVSAKSDGVWMSGDMMLKTLDKICDTRGLQARVEFFIVED